jgi:hypothetical protein
VPGEPRSTALQDSATYQTMFRAGKRTADRVGDELPLAQGRADLRGNRCPGNRAVGGCHGLSGKAWKQDDVSRKTEKDVDISLR